MNNKNRKTGLLHPEAETPMDEGSVTDVQQLSETEVSKLVQELTVYQIELKMQNEELIQAKATERATAEKYKGFFDFAPIGYFTLAGDGAIMEVNLRGATMLDRERSGLTNSLFGFFVSENTKSIFNIFLAKVFMSHVVETCNLILSSNNNSLLYVGLSGIVSENENQCLLTVIDNTGKEKAEYSLRQSNLQLQESTLEITRLSGINSAILENIGIAIVSLTENGTIETFNPAAEALLGYRASEVIGILSPFGLLDKDFLREKSLLHGLISPKGEIPDFNTCMEYLSGQLEPTFEFTLCTKEGKKVQALLTISFLRNADGIVSGYVAVAIDISTRKEAEAAIIASGQRFHNMFENHDAMMFLVDPLTGVVVDANQSGRKFYGYDFSSAININAINTLMPQELEKEMGEALKQNRNYFTFNHRLANGQIRAVDVHSTPIEIDNRVLLFSILRDVTGEKLAEDSLKSTSLKLGTLLENMQSGILFEDETRHVSIVNQAFCDIFGINAPPAALYGADCELAAQSSAQLMKDPLAFIQRINDIVNQKEIVLSDEIDLANGSVLERDYIPIIHNNELAGHLWQYRDITARIHSQEAVRRNESLLRLMANSSPLAFFVVDNRTDEILYFNYRFCEIWGIGHLEKGMESGELRNNDIIADCLLVLSDVYTFAESCKPLQSENNRVTIEDHIPFSDGRTIRRFSTQIRGDQDEYYGRLYIFEDITIRKQTEYHIGLQRDLGIGLSAVSTMQETLDLSINMLMRTGIVDRGGIYLLNNKTGNLELYVYRNLSDSFIQNTSIFTPDSLEVKLVMHGEPVFAVYDDIWGTETRPVVNESLKHIAVLPIQNEGKVFGSLNLGSGKTEEFSFQNKQTLEAFANQTGIAIARILAEEALITSQQNFHLMFETLDDFMFILNMDGKIIKTNPVVQKRLGYSQQELSAMHVLDCHPVERRNEAGAIVNEMLAGNTLFCPVPLITKQGLLIPVETRVILGKWDNEDALYGISRDITERKKTESELQLRESFLSAVINNHPGMFWLKDIKGNYIMVNDKNYTHLEYNNPNAPQDMIGKTDFDLLPALVAEKYLAEDLLVIETLQPIIREEYYAPGKIEAWYEKFKFPVVDKNGKVIGISGYSIDITERKKSEVQLRMQNAAFESFALAMMITGTDGTIQWVNPAFTALTGYTTTEVIGLKPSILHSGKQDDLFYDQFIQIIESGEVWSGELENRRKDGSIYFEEQTITPVFNENNEISNFIAIKIDVTHRKEIEEALRLSEQRWQFALEGSGDGIWDWDAGTNEVFYSKQWKAMLGYENNEISNSLDEWTLRIHPDDRDKCLGELEQHFLGATEIYVSEHRVKCKDGSYKWILDRGKTIKWLENNKPLRVIGTHTDITQQKMLEETLKKGIEKERELNDLKSRFVATASHEFRTPLASILIISDSLIAYWKKMDESQITERLDKIKEQILHLSNIVNDVLQLSKIQEGKLGINLEMVDLVLLTSDTVSRFNTDKQMPFPIAFNCNEKSLILLLDHRMMQQVLNNLISNAIKYSPAQPVIVVSIIQKHSEIVISVCDNGIGIPLEEQKHLFTPFFRATNAKSIQGNGLGLNIVYESVRLQGGKITFESHTGKGSVFNVHFPTKPKVPAHPEQDKQIS